MGEERRGGEDWRGGGRGPSGDVRTEAANSLMALLGCSDIDKMSRTLLAMSSRWFQKLFGTHSHHLVHVLQPGQLRHDARLSVHPAPRAAAPPRPRAPGQPEAVETGARALCNISFLFLFQLTRCARARLAACTTSCTRTPRTSTARGKPRCSSCSKCCASTATFLEMFLKR